MVLHLIDHEDSSRNFLGLIDTVNNIAGKKKKQHRNILIIDLLRTKSGKEFYLKYLA